MYYFGDICSKFNKDDLQHIKNTNIMARDAKKKQKALDSKNGESFMDKAKKFMEDSGLLPTDGGQSGGNGKGKGGGGGNGTGKGKEKDGKEGSAKQAQDHTIDVATITAIKGIQKVLADMGYTLTTEIKRADLFRAQREALNKSALFISVVSLLQPTLN